MRSRSVTRTFSIAYRFRESKRATEHLTIHQLRFLVDYKLSNREKDGLSLEKPAFLVFQGHRKISVKGGRFLGGDLLRWLDKRAIAAVMS
jgi:hypothetical protein